MKCQINAIRKKSNNFVRNEKSEVEQKSFGKKTQKKSINQEKEDKSNEILIKSGKNIHTFKKNLYLQKQNNLKIRLAAEK